MVWNPHGVIVTVLAVSHHDWLGALPVQAADEAVIDAGVSSSSVKRIKQNLSQPS